MYKKSQHIRQAKFLTKRWNNTVSIGDFVEYEPRKGDKSSRRVYKTKTEAFLVSDETMSAIFLENFSGYVDVSFLHPIKNKKRLYFLKNNYN